LKILLLQLKRIGDLILTTPAIAALREGFPEAHVTMVGFQRMRSPGSGHFRCRSNFDGATQSE